MVFKFSSIAVRNWGSVRFDLDKLLEEMVIHNNFIYHSREFFSTDIQFAMLYSFAGDDNMANLEVGHKKISY